MQEAIIAAAAVRGSRNIKDFFIQVHFLYFHYANIVNLPAETLTLYIEFNTARK